MPPTLSPAEIAQLTKDQARQQNTADVMTAAIPAKNAKVADLQTSDGGFKKFMDYFNTDIIKNYDDEYMALDGRMIVAPIIEADIIGPANLDFNIRTTPTTPAVDVVRVPEFDGGGTVVDPVNESEHFIEMDANITSLSTTFFDSERASKITIDPGDQAALNALISTLEGILNNRIAALDFQDTALGLNQDPDATSDISSQITANGISRTFLQNYLITTDVSDVGLATLTSEETTRSAEIITRINQINAAFTGQTENYYDKRYEMANNRAHLVRGTLRQVVGAQESVATNTTYAATAQASADSIGSLLP